MKTSGDRQLKIAGYDGSSTTTWVDGDSSGNLIFPADVTLGDDLLLDSDSCVLKFGTIFVTYLFTLLLFTYQLNEFTTPEISF